MHRFETKNGVQFIDLLEIAAIASCPDGVGGTCWCFLKGTDDHFKVPVTATELHALVKAAKEPNSVPYMPAPCCHPGFNGAVPVQ